MCVRVSRKGDFGFCYWKTALIGVLGGYLDSTTLKFCMFVGGFGLLQSTLIIFLHGNLAQSAILYRDMHFVIVDSLSAIMML
ncbi:hypothetical protein T440DRAFT_468728 [Plenodomus tracheiphilus IPT5]|uniref:Uncharacterized protein n=1 Tax=Plenodomus tracheiphilus IPT5 TaxID=1408161 RepID=A0A6A7B6M2_9PLEO|nr:hypothetical protein T440DRAFT_468728 [Plenodomus tracheiphilus IPT5]